jgi:hypothetical protein
MRRPPPERKPDPLTIGEKKMPSDVVEIRRAIEAYVDVVEALTLTPEDRLARLPAALDLLAVAVRDISYEFDEADYPDDPREDYQAIYKVVARRFPTLGYYNVAGSVTKEIGECKVLLGDGIDDIVDIPLDLKGVLWRFNNTSVDDALWDLNQGFQYHWGQHLRNLQLYLRVQASGVDCSEMRLLKYAAMSFE